MDNGSPFAASGERVQEREREREANARAMAGIKGWVCFRSLLFAGIVACSVAGSILRKLCRDGALVLYLLRRFLSPVPPAALSPSPLPFSLGAASFYGAIKLRSRVTTHRMTPPCGCIYGRDNANRVGRSEPSEAAGQRNNNFCLCRFYCESRGLSRIDSRGEVVSRMTAIANFSIVARSHEDRY